jgi:(5-formylfuran-3-yl)methyl phosphate synthase
VLYHCFAVLNATPLARKSNRMTRSPAFPLDSSRSAVCEGTSAARASKAGLLVSVRSAAEAAKLAGLDLTVLDIKEPSAGPLAAASREVWQTILTQNLLSHRPWRLSVALGECDEAVDLASQVPLRISFAKAGPASIGDLDTLQARWTTIRERLAPSIELVAVAYADHEAANCPPAEAIFRLAAQLGFTTWLIDTFVKDGASTLDHLPARRLLAIARQAQEAKAQWVLAGSMRQEMVAPLAEAGVLPDLFGVRGDVCEGPRIATIEREKVQKWICLLGHGSHPNRV